MKAGALTVRGIVEKLYFSGATFSAGVVRTDAGKTVRFKGRFCAGEGESVTLTGRWHDDPKYGPQFLAESVAYDLPESQDGLVQYLAKHPAFAGVGEVTARKLVEHAGTAARLEELLTGPLDRLASTLRIPFAVLVNLRDQWLKNAAENRVRTYLASFGLTPKQMDKLVGQFGDGIVGLLKKDPYQLIVLVDGYGFKRVDDIARKMGVPKDHPGRINAGVLHCLREEIASGHTWTAGVELLELANTLLVLDGLDSRKRIRQRAKTLIESGQIAVDGQALSTPFMLDAEKLILRTLKEHAWAEEPVVPRHGYDDGLQNGQLLAYRTALHHRVSVISGGAGTGKTYVVSRLTAAFQSAGLKVALCAPTGKAAKRIEEVLRKYGVDTCAQTIHRLLHYNGTQFNRPSLSDEYVMQRADGDSETLPAYDIVIVDEVSMVDVPLMAALMERINFERTRLVLVGDHNQLPPVGPGNVLRDVLKHRLAPTVVLDRVHRQAGILKANSSAVLSGQVAPSAGAEQGWIVVDAFRDAEQIQLYLRDLIREGIHRRLGYDPLRDVQVITPTHKGALGTKALNTMLQYLFHGQVQGRFAIGDKVIQTSNDYELGVMNGTIGFVAAETGKGYVINFEGAGSVVVEGEKAQNVQLAYVLTAHKCQGSEFPCAVVLCHKSHFFADRNWLYTAVTRASQMCIILGDAWGLKHAALKNHTIHRRTLLDKWAAESANPADLAGGLPPCL